MPLIKPAEEIIKNKMQEEKGNPIIYKGGISIKSTKKKTDELPPEDEERLSSDLEKVKKSALEKLKKGVPESEKKAWDESQNKMKEQSDDFYYKKVGEGKVEKVKKEK